MTSPIVAAAMPWQHVLAGNFLGAVCLATAAWAFVVTLWPRRIDGSEAHDA